MDMSGRDDRFDTFLSSAARELHQPPATPRDEMWSAIVADRRERIARKRQWRRSLRWGIGLAAVLTLGVAIGRMTVDHTGNGAAAVIRPLPSGVATFQAAASQHFDQVETLLATFEAEARKGRPGPDVSDAARELLSTNRLLLDSPAASDARLRQLLDDLELVLAQIAQLSAERGMDPTGLIVKALEDNGVLMRLRSAVPAGTVKSTQGAL